MIMMTTKIIIMINKHYQYIKVVSDSSTTNIIKQIPINKRYYLEHKTQKEEMLI